MTAVTARLATPIYTTGITVGFCAHPALQRHGCRLQQATMSNFVQAMAITSCTHKPLALAIAMLASPECTVGTLIQTASSIFFSKKIQINLQLHGLIQ